MTAEIARGITGLVAVMRTEDGSPDEADYAWATRALGLDNAGPSPELTAP